MAVTFALNEDGFVAHVHTTSLVTPETLRAQLHSETEWALVDVREEGLFSQGHLLAAISLPLSRLELLVSDLIPHRHTPIVVCGGDVTERAVRRLMKLGYENTTLFPGDVADWRDQGFEIFTGVHVPSKAFGEFIEARYKTPHLAAEEVNQRIQAGKDVLILDSRPLDEYRTRSIPGAIDVPGVELVYRIKDLVRSPETLVVVNCGGRTRSIIGAQSLINAGIDNRVVALKNGTMGWHLAGYPLEHNQSRRPPPVSAAGLRFAREAAHRLAKRFQVSLINRAELMQWRADSARTLYLFDVRQPEEYAAGHLPGSRHVQGGQLIQETDYYIGVRYSRVVLVDDTGVRATAVASWLRQMGLADVHVLMDGLLDVPLDTGPWRRKVLGLYEAAAPEVHAHQLVNAASKNDIRFIDLSLSTNYRRGHIPSAYFAARAQLSEALTAIPSNSSIVLTSEDGVLARLAASEVQNNGLSISALMGGNDAWRAAGGEFEIGNEQWATAPQDVWLKPFDQLQGRVEDRLNNYLSWEVGLLEQIERDGSLHFRHVPMEQ